MKKQGLNVNLKIYFIFNLFLMDFGTWWVSLGPPRAPFFAKNAPTLGENFNSRRHSHDFRRVLMAPELPGTLWDHF